MYFVLAFLVLGTAALTTLVWVFVYGPRLAWDWYSQAMRDFMVVLSCVLPLSPPPPSRSRR